MNQLFQNIEGRGEGRDYGKKKFSSNIKYKIILIKTKKMDLARHGSECDKQLLPTLLLGLLDQPEDRETEKSSCSGTLETFDKISNSTSQFPV